MIARFFRLLKLKRDLSRGYARQKIVREARAEAARRGRRRRNTAHRAN